MTLLDELQALGVAFVSLAEGIDATTPAGKLQMHILAMIAEFERGANRRAGDGGFGEGEGQWTTAWTETSRHPHCRP